MGARRVSFTSFPKLSGGFCRTAGSRATDAASSFAPCRRCSRETGLSLRPLGMLPRDNNQEGLCPAPEFLLVGDCLGSCVYPCTERYLPSVPLCLNDNTTSFIFPELHPSILCTLMAKTELCGAGPSVCALD